MHEMSIVLNIFSVIKEQLAKESYPDRVKIQKVAVTVGKLSSVVPESLEFSFNIAKKDTVFESALLEITEVPVEGECTRCGSTFSIEDPLFLCPECESPDIKITKGKELFIESIEIED